MSDAASGAWTPPANVPRCADDVCAKLREFIGDVCRANDWPPGHPVLVIEPDGSVCWCPCPAGPAADGEGARRSVPDCPPEVCASPAVRQAINEICKSPDWPAGRPVLVRNPAGGYCACYCT